MGGKAERQKWKEHHAGYPVRRRILKELLEEGHFPITMRWIENDCTVSPWGDTFDAPGIKRVPLMVQETLSDQNFVVRAFLCLSDASLLGQRSR